MKLATRLAAAALVSTSFLLTSCSPEVGSKEWCEAMAKKPKDSWSLEEVRVFARHCLR